MVSIIVPEILKFNIYSKLEEFSVIKNFNVHKIVSFIKSRRIKFDKFYSVEKIKQIVNKIGYTSQKIDFEFYDSREGEVFMDYLVDFDYQNDDRFIPPKFTMSDKTVEFMGFCLFKNLTIIDFSRSYKITDNVIELLIYGDFNKLQSICLAETPITDKSVELLVRGKFNFTQLKSLNLSKTKITDKTTEYLVKGDFLNLEELFLSMNNISDESVLNLIKGKHIFYKMKQISLHSTKISDKAIEYLVQCEFIFLEGLILAYNNLSDNSINSLILCNFRNIELIDLYSTKITDESNSLKSKYPHCYISI